ncbi:MAG TPA: DUF2330 domain-containing protein, partial [Polyangiaceae bacterium]|nr:DUF2330 domain-containing protein [Polyangiaceae bacterium]
MSMNARRIAAGKLLVKIGATLFALASTLLGCELNVAEACAIMRSARGAPPSLSRERALLVFDSTHGVEHFVREAVFKAGTDPFGFVVPTPSRPTVNALKESPFGELDTRFPFERPAPQPSHARNGRAVAKRPPTLGVTVLDVTKVGSFTAFVLAADDTAALASWLKQNQFEETASTNAWLAHYVSQHFSYVAFRYDVPASNTPGDETKSEAVDISFQTDFAYYPYFEPDLGPPDKLPARSLELWYVASSPTIPIATDSAASNADALVRPLKEGIFYPDARTDLSEVWEGAANLVPSGSLVVQRFRDDRRSRFGLGDILFAPKHSTSVDAAA